MLLSTPHDTKASANATFGFPRWCTGWATALHSFDVLHALFPAKTGSGIKADTGGSEERSWTRFTAWVPRSLSGTHFQLQPLHRQQDFVFEFMVTNHTNIPYGHAHGRPATVLFELCAGPASVLIGGSTETVTSSSPPIHERRFILGIQTRHVAESRPILSIPISCLLVRIGGTRVRGPLPQDSRTLRCRLWRSNKPYILSILSYMHVIYENIHKRVFCSSHMRRR